MYTSYKDEVTNALVQDLRKSSENHVQTHDWRAFRRRRIEPHKQPLCDVQEDGHASLDVLVLPILDPAVNVALDHMRDPAIEA